jgi:predicted RNase H-like HicB family nuclease
MKVVNVAVEVAKQEDGLWRALLPGIQGCWVDAPTMEQALHEIQNVIAMFIDVYREDARPLPPSVSQAPGEPYTAYLPIALDEQVFRKVPARRTKSMSR